MTEPTFELQKIAAIVFELFGVVAKHDDTVRIAKTFQGEPLLERDIEAFALIGHSSAKRCFAWTGRERGSERTSIVLGISPFASAQDAFEAKGLSACAENEESRFKIGEHSVVKDGIIGTHWAMLDGSPVKLAICYRVIWKPLPGNPEAARAERYQGYLYCMADVNNPRELLAENLLSQKQEITYFRLDEINEASCLLGQGSTRSRVDRERIALKMGHIVKKQTEKPN